jgi:poly-gamma-glutamate capsule biosynthesis protein CapA/YwtB (metallophosphatase superfamily)
MPENALSIAVVGDVIPSRSTFPGGSPASPGFGKVVEVISGADVAVANLDTALTDRGHPREKFINVRTTPEVAADLKRMGFDVISLANNHVMDYGDTGLFDTLEALDSAGVQTVGAGADLEHATAPAIVEANGWRLGVLAWTSVLPTGAAASPERPGQAPLHIHTSYEVNPYLLMEEPTSAPTVRTRVDDADLEFARAAIAALRTRVDFVVVLLHWGGGMSDELAEYQRPLGRALLDAGADVVVGSHAHRVLGIETYNGKAIFYSPGTLVEQLSREGLAPEIAAIMDLLSPDSFVATLEVASDGGYGIRIVPTTVDDEGVPSPAEGAAFDRIAERLVRMSAALGTKIAVREKSLAVGLGSTVAV